MPIKPVGIDENGRFPTRVRLALAEEFVTKPQSIRDGQVPIWDATTGTWVPGDVGTSGDGTAPSVIDGGAPA